MRMGGVGDGDGDGRSVGGGGDALLRMCFESGRPGCVAGRVLTKPEDKVPARRGQVNDPTEDII